MRCLALLAVLCTGVLTLVASQPTHAAEFTFQPTPQDLWDLDHATVVTWGIDWTPPDGHSINQAVLSVDNINDWAVEADDVLYIHLLDEPASGAAFSIDNEGGGDAFAGQGTLLTTYTDDDDAPNPAENWSYAFTPEQILSLTAYAANGRFGLGLDPDCHYYNDGVTLTITTAPEPASALLALAAFVLLRKKRSSPAYSISIP